MCMCIHRIRYSCSRLRVRDDAQQTTYSRLTTSGTGPRGARSTRQPTIHTQRERERQEYHQHRRAPTPRDRAGRPNKPTNVVKARGFMLCCDTVLWIRILYGIMDTFCGRTAARACKARVHIRSLVKPGQLCTLPNCVRFAVRIVIATKQYNCICTYAHVLVLWDIHYTIFQRQCDSSSSSSTSSNNNRN